MPAPLSLLDELAQVPDPRSRRGRRHPLPAILGLTVLAMFSGCQSYTAPEIRAGLRNSIIHLVKDVAPSLATAIRRLGNCFAQALDLLGLPQLE